MNPNRIVIFYLSEPEPNLNLENGAQVNPNQTWTAKIFWAGAKPEPESLFETVRHPGYVAVTFLQNHIVNINWWHFGE